MRAADLVKLIKGAKKSGDGYTGFCPAHDDTKIRSLSWCDKGGLIALKCHTGCKFSEIAAAMDREQREFFHDNGQPTVKKEISETYDYTDEDGNLLHQEVRYTPKSFSQRRPDPDGGWIYDLKGVRRVLYNLPGIYGYEFVWIVEGAKDARRIIDLGGPATTNSGGAGKWRDEYSKWLKDNGCKMAAIVPDNDTPGLKHAYQVAASLFKFGIGYKIVKLPNSKKGGDLSDWLDAGGTLEKLDKMEDELPLQLTAPVMPETKEEKPAPEGIKLRGGQLPRITDEAEAGLIANEVNIYQMDKRLITVIRTEKPKDKLARRAAGALILHAIDLPWIREIMTANNIFLRHTQRGDKWNPVDCPKDIAETYIGRAGRWNVRPLIRIIETPTLRPDGSIFDTPGYDEPTGFYLDTGGWEFPLIPQEPTKEDAADALESLKQPIREFPFITPADRSVALSAALTAIVRPSLMTAPLHAFDAPIMGSGKTLLANYIGWLATGRDATTINQGKTKEEEEKRIVSILLAGDGVICIDNVERAMSGESLCTVLTSPEFAGRILGKSSMPKLSTRAFFMCTGNNLVFTGDLVTRVVISAIDPQCERPEEREFFNLRDYVMDNRGELVRDALTILRAYHIAGRPDVGLRQFGRFEDWSDLVRAALVWLGEADPCLTRARVEASDTEKTRLQNMLQALHEAHPDGVTARTLVDECESQKMSSSLDTKKAIDIAVEECGQNIRMKLSPVSLGRWFTKHKGRIVGGLKIVDKGKDHHNIVWAIESDGAQALDDIERAYNKIEDKGF